MVAADPPVKCGFADPEACDRCANFYLSDVWLPVRLTQPGVYDVALEGISGTCSYYGSSCPRGSEGGGSDGPLEDTVLEIIAFTPECIAIGDPCSVGSGTALVVPRCDDGGGTGTGTGTSTTG